MKIIKIKQPTSIVVNTIGTKTNTKCLLQGHAFGCFCTYPSFNLKKLPNTMTSHLTFIINKTLLFSPESGYLSLNDDSGNGAHLSKPASRLLKELIELNYKTNIATRDELLVNVWENYGLVGSNNNLNTYISEIRKKIDNISEINDFIITMPKKGFSLNGEIERFGSAIINESVSTHLDKIEQQADINNTGITHKLVSDQQFISSNAPEIIKTEIEAEVKKLKNRQKYNKRRIYISLISLSTLLISSLWLTGQFYTYTSIKSNANKIDHCTVKTIDRTNMTLSYRDMEIIKKMLDENNIDCSQDERIILSPTDHLTEVDITDIQLKVCNKTNDKFDDCILITGN